MLVAGVSEHHGTRQGPPSRTAGSNGAHRTCANVPPLALPVVRIVGPWLGVRPACHADHRPLLANKELPRRDAQRARPLRWQRGRQRRRPRALITAGALAGAPAALGCPGLSVGSAPALARARRSSCVGHRRGVRNSCTIDAVAHFLPRRLNWQGPIEYGHLPRGSLDCHTSQPNKDLFCRAVPPASHVARASISSGGSTRGDCSEWSFL